MAKPRKAKSAVKQNHAQTAEQVINKIEIEREAKRQRAIISEQFYPLLVSCSKSITEANQFIQSLVVSIRQQASNKIMKLNMSDLDLIKNINPAVDKDGHYKKALKLFMNESVSTTAQLLEGMGNEIDRLTRKEMSERPLSSLKTDFIKDDETVK